MVCDKGFAVWQQWAEPLRFASVMAINQVYMAVVHQLSEGLANVLFDYHHHTDHFDSSTARVG